MHDAVFMCFNQREKDRHQFARITLSARLASRQPPCSQHLDGPLLGGIILSQCKTTLGFLSLLKNYSAALLPQRETTKFCQQQQNKLWQGSF